ncbi:MAG: hypothetical protein AB7G20_11610, partial [Sulfurimonas sp.]|uniref:hypothetical protein n=1 Tax=Sulfurimonas sp. TaxID=2022749 RepID=UPI003D0BE2D6
MATIIGTIKQIEKGQFFVQDSVKGEIKLLKEGDSLAQNDVLFSHMNNPKNAKIAVAILPLGKEIFISAKSKVSFDKHFLEKIEEDMSSADGAFDEESLETASGEEGAEDSTRMSAHFLERNEHQKNSIERNEHSKNSISSMEALNNGDTNELKAARKNSFLEDRFEIIVAKRSDNAQNQTNTPAEKEDDSLTVTLYVKNSDNSIQKLSELNWLSEDGLSVDISSLLDGRELLVAYTIPTTSTMTLGDLLNMTTIIQQGFSMQELPMFSLPNGDDSSINDMSAMMNSMMSMFMGSGMTTTDGMPMDMSTMSEPFMEMMNSFMSGMDSMPMDEFMGMMNQMMNVMMQSGMMDTMSQMASKMMEMMDGMMSAMPISQFGDMMGVMMDTFSQQMQTSE